MTERIVTERLVLEPLSAGEARAIVDGDLSGVRSAEGWPHEDTADGLRMVGAGAAEAWLVTLDGEVIGDIGTHGPPDEAGDVEIGFGLGVPYRGRRYAAEFVPALARTLLARPGVRRVVARGVLADNAPSRRTLEGAGFVLEREKDGLAWYALA